MKISEVVTALEAIRAEHGDVEVLHLDDWDYMMVEAVQFEAAVTEGGTTQPAHVRIDGGSQLGRRDRFFDWRTGTWSAE